MQMDRQKQDISCETLAANVEKMQEETETE